MRKRKAYRDIKPSLISHFPSLSIGLDIDPDVHMFTEDIHLAIMPIGGRAERQKNFSVKLQGEESDRKKTKEIIGELSQHDRYDISAMVCDAVDNIAMHLAWDGQAVFEIIKDEEQIYLHGFTSKNLFRVFNYYLQITPLSDWELLKQKFTHVNKNIIWKVEIPRELGGVNGHKKVLRKLRKYNHLGTDFSRQDLERGITSPNYDFSEYVRNSEIYFNRVTHKWGWNRRDWSQKNCTEFYTFYKTLNFHYAQAILREHIIKEINQLLVRLSVKCKLIVTGLPTAAEILQVRNDMQKGTITFTQASDRVSM